MPMAELADAIVQSGRSLLEWTAHYINGHSSWRAKVVYGDTDSVFIELAGRTREEAFRLGQEIADSITAKCPGDVVLKFEKVYLPSILVTKKRYVGYSFESPSQKVAHLDAKGIEVVRRDQCLATTKMQEKCLRILFETRDLSQVKSYLYTQWAKMLQGGDSLLMRDFIFAKEVRFGHYASASSQPPGAVVSTKAVLADEMAVPPYNWRVPYVVVTGVPNAPLKHLVYSPEEVLRRGSALRLNYNYYIAKCINPALDRVLSLCGADVFAWFQAIPRPKLRLRHINYDALLAEMAEGTKVRSRQTLMDRFTAQASCTVCGGDAQPQKALCVVCSESGVDSLVLLMRGLNVAAQREHAMSLVCQNCSKSPQTCSMYCKGDIVGPDCCESLDCELFFERGKLVTRIEDFQIAVNEIEDLAS
jgi:DNA polymerase zeta